MKKMIVVVLLNAAFGSMGRAQGFEWAKRAGLWAYDYGYGITTDYAGNIYVAGKYEMNANFSGTVVPCQGNHDIFVAKYSPSGSLSWVRTAGGHTGDYATCVATDGSNVYIAGEIEGAGAKITFVGSPITLYAQGSNDVFIAKYDLNGNLIWARRAGSYDWDKATGIACDNAGNVYVCGYYKNKATFGGTSTIYSRGEEDIFIAKYNSSGTFLWVKGAGGPGRDEAKEIKVDGSGNVYVCGMFKNTANFSGTNVTSSGYFDMFLAKYSTDGDFQWVKTAGAAWDDVAWSLTMDNAGKIFVTGEFNSSVNFGGVQLTTAGSADVFVACYNSSGNVEWAKRAGGNLADRARGIGTDGNDIFITGQFGNTATFGTTTKTAADSSDIFFTAMSNSGNFLWTSTVNGTADSFEELGYESGNAICARPDGNVYATGALLNGGVFGGTALNPYERTDIFITKLKNGSGDDGGGGGGDTGTTAETELIAAGSLWKYLDNGSDQGTSWITSSYNDSGWKTGNAELGYGDGDEATVVSYGSSSSNKYITTYFRKTFSVSNPSAFSSLELSILRDDGIVVYINGNKVLSNNMPSSVSYSTLALSNVSGSSGTTFFPYSISPSALVSGTNTIAVEIHQASPGSGDISFNLKLKGSGSSGGGGGGGGSSELIASNSSWKYLDNGTDQGTAWKIPSYNDSGWKSGNAELGYGDGDEATVVSYGPSASNKYITTYFRKIFNVVNTSTVSGMELSLVRDDGAVVYINGNEVYRDNMPSGSINYSTLASSSGTSAESAYQVANIGPSSLVNGANLIAVEIHQHSPGSSDMSFNLKLRTVSGGKMENPMLQNNTELLSFTGEEKGNKVYLSWITAREENNDYFIIERSVDQENFTWVDYVMGAGNSTTQKSYSFVDSLFMSSLADRGGVLYYRLNLTDFDGVASYSPVIEVKIDFLSSFSVNEKPLTFSIYPNPIKQSFALSISEIPDHTIMLGIYDISGKLIRESVIVNNLSEIDVSSLVPGIYLVGIKSDEEIIFSERIIVQQ